MPILDTQEKVDKTLSALKDYRTAVRARSKAEDNVRDKLGTLKTITGISSNDGPKIEEECLQMLGNVMVYGLPETR